MPSNNVGCYYETQTCCIAAAPASAVALALFAREELGRYRILLDLRTQVLGGDHLTIKKIQDRCKKHEHKQEAGMLSFVMRVETDTALGGLLGTYLNVKHESEEWKTAREQLEQARQSISVERHKQRMSALYLDAVAPDLWSRPTREILPLTLVPQTTISRRYSC
jgi:AbiV family abortive infection protein